MSNLSKIVSVSDASLGSFSPQPRDSGFAPQGVVVEQPDIRLIIEEDERSGSFIYKTLDRVTGEVVKQLPREQVVDLMRTSDYSAGAVFDTKA